MRGTTTLGACALALLLGTHLVVAGASARPAAAQDSSAGNEPVRLESRVSLDTAEVMRADPGWYQVVMPPSDQRVAFWVDRTLEQGDLTVGMFTRPSGHEGSGNVLRLRLQTEDGVICDEGQSWVTDQSAPRMLQYISVSSSAPGQDTSIERSCAGAERLALLVGGTVTTSEIDADLTVQEEPPVDNLYELSAPAGTPPWKRAFTSDLDQSTSRATKVEGATHPMRAEPLRPGAYETTISSGEQLFFRMDAEWGHALLARVRVTGQPTNGREQIAAGDQRLSDQRLGGQLVGPTFGTALITRRQDPEHRTAELSADSGAEFRMHSARVHYRNRTVDDHRIRYSSGSGPYYLVLTLTDAGERYELPIRLELAADTEPEPAPAYRGGVQPVGPAWPVNNRNTIAWWLLGGGLTFCVGGLAFLVTMRRSRATNESRRTADRSA